MTLDTSLNRTDGLGDGISVDFPYNFQVNLATDMQVWNDGVLLVGGYTVNGVGDPDGGLVTYDVAPAVDVVTSNIREVDYVQKVDYSAYDAFPAEVHEDAIDYLTMQTQQLNELIARYPPQPPGGPSILDQGMVLSPFLTLNGTLDVSGAATLQDTLDVIGLTTLADAAVTGTLAVTGEITLTGGVASTLFVDKGASGATPDVTGDTLVVESAVQSGASILSGDGTTSNLALGNISFPLGAILRWDGNDNLGTLKLGTFASGKSAKFYTDLFVLAMTLDENQRMILKAGSSGIIASASSDDFVIETATGGGMTILGAANSVFSYAMGVPGATSIGQWNWNDATDEMLMRTGKVGARITFQSGNGVEAARFTSDQRMILKNGVSGATANASADDLVIEFIGAGGMTIAGDDNASKSIFFASPLGALAGRVQLADQLNAMQIGTTFAGGGIRFLTDVGTATMVLSSVGDITLNGKIRSGNGLSGATPNADADDLVVEAAATGGISILSPSTAQQNLYLGTEINPNSAFLRWDHSALETVFGTAISAGIVRFVSGTAAEAARFTTDQKTILKFGTSGETADNNANDLVVERATACGISILAGTGQATLGLGTVGDPLLGVLRTLSGADVQLASNKVGSILTLSSGAFIEGMRLTSDQRTILKFGTSGATPDPASDDLVVESAAAGGISILTPSANIGRYAFTTPGNGALPGAFMQWDQSNAEMTVSTNHPSGDVVMQAGSQQEVSRISVALDGAAGPVTRMENLTNAPSVNHATGGHLFVSGGAIFWRGSAGTQTQLAPA